MENKESTPNAEAAKIFVKIAHLLPGTPPDEILKLSAQLTEIILTSMANKEQIIFRKNDDEKELKITISHP